MKLSVDIRSAFLSFFESRNHAIVKSSDLVPGHDPTLLFTNSGMVQFKDVFIGKEKRNYTRAATVQKCLRAGGKHNDLDNVGYTARHHTFFEMLGNFSFGDYFKEEAIVYAWDFLTKDLGISKDRLWITVFFEDEQAFSLWKRVTSFPDHKIIRIQTLDNFWSMGDIGPCGPSSEIFYDHGEHVFGGLPGSQDQDGDRFVEIWNLVFMQYEQLASGERILLPKPCIDTGMGLERMCSVLQGVFNNFETDVFLSLIQESKKLSSNLSDAHTPQAHYVIADHLRACAFLLAEGVSPSSDGRGYILRRILRRASRYAHKLGHKKPILYKLCDELIQNMGNVYPELCNANIKSILFDEEERFLENLDRGIKLLEEETMKGNISAKTAFKLYDTYGFPLDMTQDILRSKNMSIDTQAFDACMEQQRLLGRKSWSGAHNLSDLSGEFDPTLKLSDLEGTGVFLGLVQEFAIFDQSPFYGESGGQVGDTGTIQSKDFKGIVEDTKITPQGVLLHKIRVVKGELTIGETYKFQVSFNRFQIAAHHSATHLLHSALRTLIGPHVKQKGSLVNASKLRFDFSCAKPVTEIDEIEDWVNQIILQNIPSTIQTLSYEEALSIGATALFDEKYGNKVRVVRFLDVSIELCGGSHVKQTGDIGLFKIISEQSVSSGIRRIEAICGQRIIEYIRDIKKTLNHERIVHQQTIQSLKKIPQKIMTDALIEEFFFKGYPALKQHFEGESVPNLKQKIDELKKRLGLGLVIVTHQLDQKVSLLIGVAGDIPLDAVSLVKKGVVALGGQGGGGRKDLAQGGGNNPNGLKNLLKALE